MIEPGFATMLCFVQTDAEVADSGCAPCARAVGASFERITVDGQMSTNDTVLLQATGAAGAPLPGRAARRRPAAARARDRRRRRGRDAGRADRGRRRPPTRARPSGWRGRSPTRRSSRRRSTGATRTGGGSPRPPGWRWPARSSRSSAPDAIDAAELGGRRGRGRDRDPARPRRRRRPHVLLRPHARVHPDQRGVHDVSTQTSGTAGAERRDAARGAALHQGVPRPDRGDQVRRRGDARRGAARRLRHRRRPAQVRRPEPGDRPRRRPGDHPLHGAARGWRSGSSRGCASPTPRRSRWRRWSCSARSTPTSSAAQPPRPARGRPLGRGRRRCSRCAPHGERRPGRFVGEIERVDVDVLNHIAEDYIPVVASAGTDREGNSYNVNADTAAGKVAAALAPTRRSSSPTSRAGSPTPRIPARWCRAPRDEVTAALGEVEGGMRPKLGACIEAIAAGCSPRTSSTAAGPLAAGGAVH